MEARQVNVVEVGLRDGLQLINECLPTEGKLRWLQSEYDAGVRHFEAGAFVPARYLPQLADTATIVAEAKKLAGATVTALVPNEKGAVGAVAAGVDGIIVPLSASRAHSKANVRRSPEEMIAELARIKDVCDSGPGAVRVIAGISTAFGCTLQGVVPEDDVIRLVEACLQIGVDSIGLADTVGYANPAQVHRLFTRVKSIAGERLESGHFHDTRGLGLANVAAALDAGIRTFDSSLGGLGGCQHAPGASGNIATEDLVYMLEAMGLRTSINLEALLQSRRVLAEVLPHEQLHGKLAQAGIPRTTSMDKEVVA